MELTLLFEMMLVVVLGIGSQWLAWRFNMPAIVIMSFAGLVVGPFLGIMNPEQSFGDLYSPIISVAVAIILFEGSLNLRFKDIKGSGRPILQISTIGAFIAWILGSLTAHYMAGLSWEVSFVIGGLFIVTGPTVILPLLRQSKLKPRPANVLKWEGIVVDPIGVLVAIFAFEIITFFTLDEKDGTALALFFGIAIFAALFGWICGRVTGWLFENGHIPEFLKSPILLVAVIFCFALLDEMKHGTGLLSVTAMGMTLANMKLSAAGDFQKFKEDISVILISAIFIMLAASLQMETILHIFNPNIIGYVLFMMFLVRPLSIFLSTIGSGLSIQEKALIGWIAPRGIVALTVSGYFASILSDAGYSDASLLTALTFGLVIFTVIAHGFSIGPLARRLNLSLEGKSGVIIVGSNAFTAQLAQSFQKNNVPVLIIDSSWENLSVARAAGVPFYHGEILSEQTEYNLDTIPYDYLIAATDSYTYNALVCTTFTPEYGHRNVFKIKNSVETNGGEVVTKVGGRVLFHDYISVEHLIEKIYNNHLVKDLKLTEENITSFVEKDFDEVIPLYIIRQEEKIILLSPDMRVEPVIGDIVVYLEQDEDKIEVVEEKREVEFV